MKLKYMCLHSALDLWLPSHFELEFFASWIGRLSYVENLEIGRNGLSSAN